ncbi:MAG TPA: M55 family metallopeptidase [Candidatus Limnocylindria bacterium]|nr:M55 family metallopeptidase [Candidatus Limnocylindria bacterium]
MRVYLSVDMEGLAGVSHAKPTTRGDDGYPAAAELMVGETNAAIEGAFAGGATDVTVNDSHGGMFNLIPEKLDPRARLVQGTKPFSMVEAARDSAFDVALFVGYHARAGHPRGTISHTYTGRITLVTLNGRPASEAALNGLYLGSLGVPVGLVTGDDALIEEIGDWLPWAELVAVKRGVSWQAADSLHPARARELIRDGARRAVERASGADPALRLLELAPPLELRIQFVHPGQADMAAMMPGFERAGDREAVYVTDDVVTLYRALISAARISRVADD